MRLRIFDWTNMSTRLTILHTESHRSWGGQELRVLTECLWMEAQGQRAVLAAAPDSQIYERATETGLETYPFSFDVLSAPADLIRLRYLMKKLQPSVLNTHGNMDSKVALTAARGLGIPCVIRSRHHSHPVSPTWYNKVLYRHFSHYVFTTATCISDQLVRDLNVPENKVMTFASGITIPEELPARDESRRRLQHDLQLSKGARFIGCVSMLRDWKGHAFLVDAFHQIKDACGRHHLVLVGDGDQRASLKAQAEKLGLTGRVHFMGFQKDPWPFFRAFDCHALASTRNEGIPQVLLQAMYAETPVIGTSVGGIPDIISHGRTGLLVKPENPDELGKAILATLENDGEAKIRSEKAFAFVASEYTIDSMGNKLLRLYHETLAKSPKQ
jgi:glycosyltransferase involved in cell wall biosynthesis